jgi:predicted TIM-barrel fold metal-dependent hydrolase
MPEDAIPVPPPLPPLACDSHMHIFGPPQRFPGAPGRTYDPREKPLADYEAVAGPLGLKRFVLVQPSAYATDNACLMETLRHRPDAARAVVVLPQEGCGRAALEEMHAAGVRGVRLNLMTPRIEDRALARQRLDAAARMVARFGWHIQIYADLALVKTIAPACRDIGVPVVFDHMAGAKAATGAAADGWDDLLRLLADGTCWVKLSGADIVTWEGRDFSGATPFAEALVAANDRQLVWGSDWPHLVHHASGTGDAAPPAGFRPVDEAALLGFLHRWCGTAARWRAILSENPARLYDF